MATKRRRKKKTTTTKRATRQRKRRASTAAAPKRRRRARRSSPRKRLTAPRRRRKAARRRSRTSTTTTTTRTVRRRRNPTRNPAMDDAKQLLGIMSGGGLAIAVTTLGVPRVLPATAGTGWLAALCGALGVGSYYAGRNIAPNVAKGAAGAFLGLGAFYGAAALYNKINAPPPAPAAAPPVAPPAPQQFVDPQLGRVLLEEMGRVVPDMGRVIDMGAVESLIESPEYAWSPSYADQLGAS